MHNSFGETSFIDILQYCFPWFFTYSEEKREQIRSCVSKYLGSTHEDCPFPGNDEPEYSNWELKDDRKGFYIECSQCSSGLIWEHSDVPSELGHRKRFSDPYLREEIKTQSRLNSV